MTNKKTDDAFELFGSKPSIKKRPWITESAPSATSKEPETQNVLKVSTHQADPRESIESSIFFQKRWSRMPSKFEQFERKTLVEILKRHPADLLKLTRALLELEEKSPESSAIGTIQKSWDEIRINY